MGKKKVKYTQNGDPDWIDLLKRYQLQPDAIRRWKPAPSNVRVYLPNAHNGLTDKPITDLELVIECNWAMYRFPTKHMFTEVHLRFITFMPGLLGLSKVFGTVKVGDRNPPYAAQNAFTVQLNNVALREHGGEMNYPYLYATLFRTLTQGFLDNYHPHPNAEIEKLVKPSNLQLREWRALYTCQTPGMPAEWLDEESLRDNDLLSGEELQQFLRYTKFHPYP